MVRLGFIFFPSQMEHGELGDPMFKYSFFVG